MLPKAIVVEIQDESDCTLIIDGGALWVVSEFIYLAAVVIDKNSR